MAVDKLCYTPIKFVKTEVIDVDRTSGQLGTERTAIGKFIEERTDPVQLGYDHLILKEKASGITKGRSC